MAVQYEIEQPPSHAATASLSTATSTGISSIVAGWYLPYRQAVPASMLTGPVCMLAGASPIDEVSLQQYSKSLQRVAVLRLLQQLSHVYSVMKIPALADLVPFMGFGEVEQIIVDAVKHDFLQVSRPLQCTPTHRFCLGHARQ